MARLARHFLRRVRVVVGIFAVVNRTTPTGKLLPLNLLGILASLTLGLVPFADPVVVAIVRVKAEADYEAPGV